MLFSAIIFILTLLLLVVIHELGHFLMAKKFGIKVLEFGFGIPPRAWGKKIGETIYSLNYLPLGGFVRLLGEDEVDKEVLDNKRSFAYQNVYKRIAVVLAGVVMNFLLAFVLFYIVLGFSGFKSQLIYNGSYNFVGATQNIDPMVIVREIVPDSPAAQAGIKVDERIVAVNFQPIKLAKSFSQDIKNLAGTEISLTISDTEKKTLRDVKITPRKTPPPGQGALGLALSSLDLATISYDTPAQKLFAGPIHSWNVIAYSAASLKDIFSQAIEKKDFAPVSSTVAGPVGITTMANSILTQEANPLLPYLSFMALISLNLAVFNLLPFPALDGGRLFFLYIEALTRKKVHAGFEKWVHTIGIAILIGLSVLITFSDIRKLI